MIWFIIKLLICVACLIFLSVIFIKRFFLVLTERKMQAKLLKEASKIEAPVSQPESTPVVPVSLPEPDSSKVADTRSLFKKGEMAFAKKDYDSAQKYFVKVLEIDENHADGNLQLGLTYLKQKNFPKAEFVFHKLVNLKKDPIYYSNLGLALYSQGRLLEAAEAYENALSLDSKRAARFASLAQIYRELNNDEKAVLNFEKASKKSPRNTEYLWALVEYYRKLGREEDLFNTAKKILELDPYNEDAKKILG